MTREKRQRGPGDRSAAPRSDTPGIDDLEPQEAIEVLRRLSKKHGAVGEAVDEEIRGMVLEFDPVRVASDIHWDLDGLAVEDLWDRSGPKSHGYTNPTDEAWAMVEEVVRPHVERIRKYQQWGMTAEAWRYCVAVLDGIASYDLESSSEFKEHAPDDAAEAFHWVVCEWKKGERKVSAIHEFDHEVAKRFPERV